MPLSQSLLFHLLASSILVHQQTLQVLNLSIYATRYLYVDDDMFQVDEASGELTLVYLNYEHRNFMR